MTRWRNALVLAALVALVGAGVHLDAQVTSDRLLNAAAEARNWLTYSGGYASHRHTTLTQLTPANVSNLEQKWVFQGSVVGTWQSSPLVVDGVMYITQRPNDVIALEGYDAGVSFRSEHDPVRRIAHTVISNTSDGTWPLTRLLAEQLST